MANLIYSITEDPEYLFDHSERIKIDDAQTDTLDEPHCVAIDPFTDQIYVLLVNELFGNGTVLIYSQSGEFLRSFSHEKMEYTHGMEIHKNNVYIVLGLSCLLHFEIADSISLIDSKDDKGSGIGEFMGPRQLDISNEGDLFVADFGNDRIQILDGKLQYKRHISHDSMLKPCDLKLTPDEVYVLGDTPKQSTYCIQIFTLMGEKLHSIILNKIPNNVRCRGFCVDTYGNIIIIDNATSQIKFFTKEGNLFETMNTLDRIWSSFKHIFGVAWMTNQKLIVLSTYFCNRLEIYSSF